MSATDEEKHRIIQEGKNWGLGLGDREKATEKENERQAWNLLSDQQQGPYLVVSFLTEMKKKQH